MRRTICRAMLLAVVVSMMLIAPATALQRSDFRLPGTLLRGAVGEGRLYLLVGGDAKAARQLIELRLTTGGGALVTLASDLPASVETVLATPASGGAALLSGGGAITAVDAGRPASRRQVYGGPGLLIGGGEGGTFAARPPWLAAGRAGEVRRLAAAGGALAAGEPQALPVTASLERWGLRLVSPEARFTRGWLAVGPLQEGIHLRTVLLGAAGERQELTAELPEPERLADSAVVTLDGRPTLVVGTFRGLGLMSRKRLRVFALAGEPGAAPRRPLLARELAARAWQDLQVRAGDFDGDGRDDLAIASADGLAEGEARVTIFRGLGGGRLRAEPLQASYPVKGLAWRYGADVDGDRRPDLVTLGGGMLALHFANGPGGLPAKKPSLTVKVDGTDVPSRRKVEVAVGSRGARTTTSKEGGAAPDRDAPPPAAAAEPRLAAPEWELVDIDGDGRAELLWWAPETATAVPPSGKGETHLIVLRF